jgi:prolyl 4-hydroxylase
MSAITSITPPVAIDGDPLLIGAHPRIQRVPNRDLTLFIQRNFLTAEECAALVDRIDTQRRPSTIADANGDTYFRTSETCDLDHSDPFVAAINARLDAFAGIATAHGEPIQGQRYAVGQEFKAHTDYFDPKGADYPQYCSVAGNRTWTLMIYLDAPAAGGATRFTKIGKTVQSETGKLLAWNNRLPDGQPNPASIHHGMKVRSGVKHVITKWYRERPWG